MVTCESISAGAARLISRTIKTWCVDRRETQVQRWEEDRTVSENAEDDTMENAEYDTAENTEYDTAEDAKDIGDQENQVRAEVDAGDDFNKE